MQMGTLAIHAGNSGFPHWNSVFCKTNKGREELTHKRAGLSLKQRSVLIMLDGSKKLSALLTPVPRQELAEIVDFLATQELITSTDTPEFQPQPAANATQQAAAEKPASTALIQDLDTLCKIKALMTTTAQTCLGLLSADVVRRVESAKDAAQLTTVLGHWHMALRDSRQGPRFAAAYMEQIGAALRGEAHSLPI
ncbi:hypothetical protein [Undibacterium sp. TJN19]|uniref:hypothetical protein n=1 Tax=Undibacterium sp. TJN19 TaxID=3413055 RepID=UPI003BF3E261